MTHFPNSSSTGKKIVHLGHVFGITVRARNIGVTLGAGLKSLAGGEVSAYTKNFEQSRKQALDRMIGMAHSRGADAVSETGCECIACFLLISFVFFLLDRRNAL